MSLETPSCIKASHGLPGCHVVIHVASTCWTPTGIEHFWLTVNFGCVTAVMTSPVPQWNCGQWSCRAAVSPLVAPSWQRPKRIGTQRAPESHHIAHTEGTIIVRIETNHIALLLSAGATALTIAAAPNASAPHNEQPYSGTGGSTQCQHTGNAQIPTAPAPMTTPYGCIMGLNCGGIPHHTCLTRGRPLG